MNLNNINIRLISAQNIKKKKNETLKCSSNEKQRKTKVSIVMSYRAYPDTKHNTGTFLSRESKMLRENFNIRDIERRKPVLGEEGNNESR